MAPAVMLGVHVRGEPTALLPLLPGGTVLLPGPHPAEGAQAVLEKKTSVTQTSGEAGKIQKVSKNKQTGGGKFKSSM